MGTSRSSADGLPFPSRPAAGLPAALLAALATAAPAWGAGPPGGEEENFLSPAPWRLAVSTFAESITRLSAAGRHGDALVQIGRLLDHLDAPENAASRAACLPVGDGHRWVGVYEWLQVAVAGWPEPALRQYRARFDADADRLMERARELRDRAPALEVYRRYRNCTAGPAACEFLAGLFLEDGRPGAALHFRRAALAHPLTTPAARRRLLGPAVLDALAAGDLAGSARHLAEFESLPAAPAATVELLRRRLADARKAGPPRPDPDAAPQWSQPGGGPTHSRVWPDPVGADVLLAGFELTALFRGDDDPPGAASADAAVRPDDPAIGEAELRANWSGQAHWPVHYPTVRGGRVVLADERGVAAVRLLPAGFVGRSPADAALRLPDADPGLGRFAADRSAGPHPMPRTAVLDGLVAVWLPGPSAAVNPGGFGPPGGLNRLAGHDLTVDGGECPMLWRYSVRNARGRGLGDRQIAELASATLDPVLAADGRLYAVARLPGGPSLMCLSGGRAAPQLLFYTPLGSARPPADDFSPYNVAPAVPASDGLRVYVPTHQGFVVAADAADGSVVWFHDYLGRRAWKGLPDQELSLSAPVLEGGRLYLFAADTREMLCLSADDGRLIWKTPAPTLRHLVGRVGDRLIAVGDAEVRAFAAADGRVLWSAAPGRDEIGAPPGPGPLSGAPALSATVLHWPGRAGLVGFDVSGDAPRTVYAKPYHGLGNLLAFDGMLIAVSGDQPGRPGTARLRIFSRWSDLEPRIRRTLDRPDTPADTLAALGELCERLGQTDAALDLWRKIETAHPVRQADARRERFRLLCTVAERSLAGDEPDGRRIAAAELHLGEAWRYVDNDDGRRARYWLAMGRLHEVRGELDEAMGDYRRILADAPVRNSPVQREGAAAAVPAWAAAARGQARLLRFREIADRYRAAAQSAFAEAARAGTAEAWSAAVMRFPRAPDAGLAAAQAAGVVAAASGPEAAVRLLEPLVPLIEESAAAPAEAALAEYHRLAGRPATARRLLIETARRHGDRPVRMAPGAEPAPVRDWVVARLAAPEYSRPGTASGLVPPLVKKWELPVGAIRHLVVPETVGGGGPDAPGFLVVGPRTAAFWRLDDLRAGNTRTPAWTRPMPAMVNWAGWAAGRLILVHDYGAVCVDPADGATEHWSLSGDDGPRPQRGQPFPPPPPALTGTERHREPNPEATLRFPMLVGGLFGVVINGRRIVLRDVAGGQVVWQADTDAPVGRPVIVTDRRVIAVTIDRDGRSSMLTVFDRLDGRRYTRKVPPGLPLHAGQILGDLLAVRDARRHVVRCLRLADGSTAWEQPVGPADGGDVWITSAAGRFLVFGESPRQRGKADVASVDPATGRILGRVLLDPTPKSETGLVDPRTVRVEDSRLTLAVKDSLMCLRLSAPDAPDDLAEVWSRRQIARDPVPGATPDWLWYICPPDTDGGARVRLIDRRNGEIVWTAPAPAGLRGNRRAVILGPTLLLEGSGISGWESGK